MKTTIIYRTQYFCIWCKHRVRKPVIKAQVDINTVKALPEASIFDGPSLEKDVPQVYSDNQCQIRQTEKAKPEVMEVKSYLAV